MTRMMKSYVKGLLMGCCLNPLLMASKKEPVPYLYNGATKTLIVNEDDGSLSFDFNWDTMQMDVSVK